MQKIYEYVEDTFTDKVELLLWLKKVSHPNPTKIISDRVIGNKVEHIYGCNNELEDMINAFFEKEGENNLYFEFG